MKTTKLKTLEEISKIRNEIWVNKKVVLVTGCFDILHIGHVEFFRFAKSLADYLVVGVDNDQNVKANKGFDRPIFSLEKRINVLSELQSIDVIFPIKEVVKFNSDEADKMLVNIIAKVSPNFLVIHQLGEVAKQRKNDLSRKFSLKVIEDQSPKIFSSTKIIEKILKT